MIKYSNVKHVVNIFQNRQDMQSRPFLLLVGFCKVVARVFWMVASGCQHFYVVSKVFYVVPSEFCLIDCLSGFWFNMLPIS